MILRAHMRIYDRLIMYTEMIYVSTYGYIGENANSSAFV